MRGGDQSVFVEGRRANKFKEAHTFTLSLIKLLLSSANIYWLDGTPIHYTSQNSSVVFFNTVRMLPPFPSLSISSFSVEYKMPPCQLTQTDEQGSFRKNDIVTILHMLEILNNLCGPGIEQEKKLSYRPARLHRLAESIQWNPFLCSLKVEKYRLCYQPLLVLRTSGTA